RRLKAGGDGAGNLTPERHPALVGDIALFGEAELPDHSLEALRIEVAADPPEIGIVDDHAHCLGGGLSKPQPSCILVECCLGNGLLQQLTVNAEGAGLIRRQGAAELASDLLQLVRVELAKLVDGDLGMSDRGQCRLSETLENVGNPPDAETDDQDTHHDGHYGLAEPV